MPALPGEQTDYYGNSKPRTAAPHVPDVQEAPRALQDQYTSINSGTADIGAPFSSGAEHAISDAIGRRLNTHQTAGETGAAMEGSRGLLMSGEDLQSSSQGLGGLMGDDMAGAIADRTQKTFEGDLNHMKRQEVYAAKINDMKRKNRDLSVAQDLAQRRYDKTLDVIDRYKQAQAARAAARAGVTNALFGAGGKLAGAAVGSYFAGGKSPKKEQPYGVSPGGDMGDLGETDTSGEGPVYA